MAAPKKSKKSKAKRDELAGHADPRAALDSGALLAAAKPVLQRLEEDLQARAVASPAVTAALTARYEAEKAANRTAESFAGWTAALATQVAAAWLLSCVFVRTLEDRGLLKQARLAGPGAEDSQKQFFQLAPSLTERDYLLTVFSELARHPAAAALFDAEHNLVWKLSPSAELAKELLALFRAPIASEPAFRFGQASTRFLGDLYQDLSEDVRKRYALLQTPDFVEAYILDRTLEPAIARFGLDDTTLIDPTCGSGHFLLGAFDRLYERRLRAEPGIDARVAATKAIDCVYGADINPYAIAIARFRLTLAFLDKAGYVKLADAPALPLHLVCADSLRINPQHPQQELWQHAGAGSSTAWLGDVFTLDDERVAKDVLGRQYAAVVGNPPYITVKDKALREVYRAMYVAAAGKYALSAPFCERIFQLARPRGYTGQITANSFMKREFGKQLVENYLPTVSLERIVNTSGAYIPGHGTPTVLLFGTNEVPQGGEVHAVLAKRGEPSTPDVSSQGLVWRSIVDHGDAVGFENDYLSVARLGRDSLAKHPWSLGGGGASELKELLEERAGNRLGDVVDSIGVGGMSNADDVYIGTTHSWARLGVDPSWVRPLVIGEEVRDWFHSTDLSVFFPYDGQLELRAPEGAALRAIWPYRQVLWSRAVFGGGTYRDANRPWFEWHQVTKDRLRTPLTITFAFVATHNHFVLDHGGKVFKQTAPIIKLHEGATEDDHLVLLAYLNSSTACFWMKQVCQSKGATAANHNHPSVERAAYEFAGTALMGLPVPDMKLLRENVVVLSRLAETEMMARAARLSPKFWADSVLDQVALKERLRQRWIEADEHRERANFAQEEIDWLVYSAMGLTEGLEEVSRSPERLPRGQRAFEVIAGHRSFIRENGDLIPIEVAQVTSALQKVSHEYEAVRRSRIRLIRETSSLALIETYEFKRHWRDSDLNVRESAYREEYDNAQLREWLLAQLESGLAAIGEPTGLGPLVATAQELEGFTVVAEVLNRMPIDDLRGFVSELLSRSAVPNHSAIVYTESGLAKRAAWEETWRLQRMEDAGGAIGGVPVPPTYSQGSRGKSKDFLEDVFWQLRGSLDVAKERFISYPCCESDQDGEPVYGWAGWDHLQRAQALASLYLKRKDGEGWTKDRLTPMLAGLLELIPWVKQWHNEPSAEFGGLRMGDYFGQFLDGECRQHGLTHDDLRAWRPPKKARSAAKISKSKKEASTEPDQYTNGDDSDEDSLKPKKSRAKKKPAAADAAAAPTEAE